jgi:hypothetical protein
VTAWQWATNGGYMSEREDLQSRVDIVLENLAIAMESWQNTGLDPNSALREGKELREEAIWEQQADLAARLADAIGQAERQIERGRS